ncbi:MAG: N-acetylglucosamine-6-phosphate deacetylase [Spirochaetota bacterium]|nr:N-acetylglucosamine-6-phosphate deacetylase [Spirochaetota bacterium]
MKGIKASKIFNGSIFIHDAVIVWNNNRIVNIGNQSILSLYNIEKHNIISTPNIIVPGFVDIQVNGAGGANFYGEGLTLENLTIMAQTLNKYGCTSFCPTLITSSDKDINTALDLINSISDLDTIGVLGLHIEGPMFSQEHKGAHNPELIRVLSPELIDKICKSKVKIVSLSPEVAPLEYIRRLTDAGIKVSIAHTNSTLDQVRIAESFGSTMGTHLYNGMSRFSSREPNVVGALLTSKNSFSSIIPDGIHSDFNSIIMAHKCLGERLITITDGIVAMGTDMTTFKLGFQNVHINEKNHCIGDYGGLAGSMITPIECLQNLVNYCEFSLEEALISYTSAPANSLGMEKSIGYLMPDNYADFLILDNDLNLKSIYVKGNLI